jgi:hypothetical protein
MKLSRIILPTIALISLVSPAITQEKINTLVQTTEITKRAKDYYFDAEIRKSETETKVIVQRRTKLFGGDNYTIRFTDYPSTQDRFYFNFQSENHPQLKKEGYTHFPDQETQKEWLNIYQELLQSKEVDFDQVNKIDTFVEETFLDGQDIFSPPIPTPLKSTTLDDKIQDTGKSLQNANQKTNQYSSSAVMRLMIELLMR